MSTRIEMREKGIGGGRAGRSGVRDPLVRELEARRRQAEAIVDGVHWAWTGASRIVRRMAAGGSGERRAAANDNRASGAAPGLLRRAGQAVLSFLASWQRRRAAIDELRALDDRVLTDIGLRRDQIELAVDGLLPRGGETRRRPLGRGRWSDGFEGALAA